MVFDFSDRGVGQYPPGFGFPNVLAAATFANGMITNYGVNHKFGSVAVSQTLLPVAFGGVWRTPKVADATALRVKAGNVADTAAGAGAREVTVQGLDETGAEIEVALPTAGTSAGAASSETFIRVNRAWVSSSGSYGTVGAGGHTAAVVIEKAAGSEDWLTIDATDYSLGQSEIAAYSVPLGKRAYIKSFSIQVDSNFFGRAMLFQRRNILDAAAPYSAPRLVIQAVGVVNAFTLSPEVPLGPFPALTDLFWLADVTQTTGTVSVDFEIILENT